MLFQNKTKILMILFEDVLTPLGGMGVHVYAISQILKLEFDITILSISAVDKQGLYVVDNNSHKQAEMKDWIYNGSNFRILYAMNYQNTLSNDAEVQEVTKYDVFMDNAMILLRDHKFDLIHLHDADLWKIARNIKTLLGIPLILTVHLSTILSFNLDSPYYRWAIQKEGEAICEADHIITVSNNYKDEITKRFPQLENLIVIHNGVDGDFLKSIPYDEELKKKYDKKLVVFVGRLVPSKGIDMIMDAAIMMKDYHFILFSRIAPTMENNFYLSIKGNRLDDELDNFTLFSDDKQKDHEDDFKWKMMKIADIGIVPSLHEPFGIIGLEWLGLGKVPIVTKVGGLVEFCNDDNSVMIEPNVFELIEAINNHKSDKIKEDNAIKTTKEFSWKNCVDKIKQVYTEVLEKW